MKKLFLPLLMLLNLFLLFSCDTKRGENGDLLLGLDENPTTGGASTTTQKLLSKVFYTDSEGEKLTFTYHYTEGKLVQVTTDDNSITYDLTYNGSQITKMKIVSNDGTTTATSNLNISYNNNSFAGAEGTYAEQGGSTFVETVTPTYTAGEITKIISKAVGKNPLDPNVTYDLWTLQSDITYTGANISEWKFSTLASPIPAIIITTKFSNYDNYKNPFNTLPEVFNIISAHYSTEYSAVSGLSANNYKSIAVSTEFGNDSTTYVYSYDSDGYPTEGISQSGNLKFEYIKKP